MRKQKLCKMLSVVMTFSMLCSLAPCTPSSAKSKPHLSKKSVVVKVGQSKSITSKSVKSNIKVTIKKSKASKKIASVVWNKKKRSVKVTGIKKGTTTVQVRFKRKSSVVVSKLKIQVNAKTNGKDTVKPTATVTPIPPQASIVPTGNTTASPNPVITKEPTISPSSTPVVIPTAVPTATPLFEAEYSDDNMPVKDIYKDYFMVGAAINGSSSKTMALNHKGMTGILLKHFNSTVMSNLMKPEHLLDENASKNSSDGMPVCKFDTCDDALEFCLQNGIKMRGHTLLWHNQTPEWFFFEDYDTTKSLVDSETMEKRMESYIKQVITHCQDNFPGVVYCWDVVNECVCVDKGSFVETTGGWKLRSQTQSDNDFAHDGYVPNFWYATMGESYVEKAFTYARKYADKDVSLFYNDYNVFQTEKMNNIYTMVNELKQKGIIDGIGLQPTVLINYPDLDSDNKDSFKNCLEKYAELGLQLQVTELSFKLKTNDPDEDDLQEQADRYQEFMNLLLKEDSDNGGPCNITSVTVFGICDDYPLYDDTHQNLYLWDKNCVPKPCFYSFIQPGIDLLAAKE